MTCGGTPNGERVLKSFKNLDIKFQASDSATKFLASKKQLLKTFETCYAQETIYTLIAIFEHTAPTLKTEIAMMTCRECHYTSFHKFFEEFEARIFPDLGPQLLQNLRNFKQEKKNIRTYYIQYLDLLKECGREPNSHILDFINGLTDPEIQIALQNRPFGLFADTLKDVAEHAIRIEQAKKERKAKKEGSNAQISSMDRQDENGSENGNGNGKKQGRKKKQKAKANIAATSATDTSSKTSSNAPKSQRKKETPEETIARHNEIMKKHKLNKCAACFGNHQYAPKFQNCAENARCVFCEMLLKGQRSHASVVCIRKPKDENEFREKIKEKGII